MSKFTKVLALDEATRTDVASSTVTYIGKALVGSLTSASVWKVSRMTSDNPTAGSVFIQYTDSGNYTQIWDNRAGLTYV